MLQSLVFPSWDPEIPFERWQQFVATVSAWALLLLVLGTGAIVLLYALHARRLRIRTAADLFRPYAPLRWLWLSLLPGAAAGALLSLEYAEQFSASAALALPGALRLGAIVAAATFALAYALVCLPGVTPAKFRYRPVGIFVRSRAASEDA